MQLQFLAPVELFFTVFDPGGIIIFFMIYSLPLCG